MKNNSVSDTVVQIREGLHAATSLPVLSHWQQRP
jgi:hypothetical protein